MEGVEAAEQVGVRHDQEARCGHRRSGDHRVESSADDRVMHPGGEGITERVEPERKPEILADVTQSLMSTERAGAQPCPR